MKFRFLLCVFLCVSCVNFKHNYGYQPNLDKIQIGSNKKELQDKIGMPAYSLNNREWYYISTQVKRNLLNPSYTSSVTKITFDNNKVINIEEIEKSKSPIPKINSNRTPGKGIYAEKNIKDKIIDGFKKLRPSL